MQDAVHTSPTTLADAPIAPVAACPTCGCSRQTDFFEVRGLPVHVGILFDTREQARQATTGDVILTYCHGCGFVYNRLFEPAKMSYRPGYEVSLVHSKVFLSFIEGVAKRLIDKFDLHNKTVVEIGCGGGEFLRMLCELGDNDGIGIDPSVRREGVESINQRQVRFIRDHFSQEHVGLNADFVCCLSVLEHIPNPAETIRNVRRLIGDRDAGVYFEIFNAFNAFRNGETWSVLYEQCNYFGLDSFRGLFEQCGFRVTEAVECYQGSQYLAVDAVGGQIGDEPLRSEAEHDLPPELATFADAYAERLAIWQDRIEQFRQTGTRVVVWGAGGKGVNFLNTLDTADLIPYVLEINPRRQGKYIPGSAQKVVAPEFMAEYRPDVVIITNALYEQEMKQQAAALGVDCKFLIA